MSKKNAFEKAQASIENMDQLGKFLLSNWSDFCLNAWHNSPNMQGDYDPDKAPTISIGGWRAYPDDVVAISYEHCEEKIDGKCQKGWRCVANFVLKHNDLETRGAFGREHSQKKSYWFQPDTYFVDTGLIIRSACRYVDDLYRGEEKVNIMFTLLETQWPKLKNSWDQMQVMKRLCPDDAKELPDFVQ